MELFKDIVQFSDTVIRKNSTKDTESITKHILMRLQYMREKQDLINVKGNTDQWRKDELFNKWFGDNLLSM